MALVDSGLSIEVDGNLRIDSCSKKNEENGRKQTDRKK